MKTQSYYRLQWDNDCNIRDLERPLVVNCTGLYRTGTVFSNSNSKGRVDFYLMYMAEGWLELGSGPEEHRISTGEMFIFPPGTPYRYSNRDGGGLCYYWAHFTGGKAEDMLNSYGLSPGKVYRPQGHEEVAADFRGLFRCFYGKGPLFEAEAAGTLAALLARLARRATLQQQSSPGLWRIQSSLEFLYRNYTQAIRLEELAAMEHLSPSRYSAVFRGCMGVSPQNFLIGLRIQNAANLLRRTDLTIAQVAQAVGYEDPLYFSGLFHRKMGMSPSCYRGRTASA